MNIQVIGAEREEETHGVKAVGFFWSMS